MILYLFMAVRAPFHIDSLIALGCVLYALSVALLINHRRANFRVLGIALAALGCFSLFAWITILGAGGALSEIRPGFTFADPVKPLLMRLFSLIFLLASLALALTAWGQRQRQDALILPRHNEAARYGQTARLFHWVIAILFIILVPMGVFTSMIPFKASYREAYYVVHKSVGLTVMILAICRLVWLIKNPAPKLDDGLSKWEKFAAHSAHKALYLFLFAFPISGYVMSTYSGKLSYFYIFDLPLLWGTDFDAGNIPNMVHKIILPYLFYLVILAHISGALKHRFVDKKADALKRMVT